MKPSLTELLNFNPEELAENLDNLACQDLSAAFDLAVILSKNLHPDGKRMPLVLDFIVAQFDRMEKCHSAHGIEFNALAAVGNIKSAAPTHQKRAAELFASKIQGIASLDKDKAKGIALNIKASAREENPVRKEALKYLIEEASYEELEDLARHAHHFSEEEQLMFLGKVESQAQDRPNAVKRLIDGYINRVGYSMSAAGKKAEAIFDACEKTATPAFAIIGANADAVTYLGEKDEAAISVPFDRTLN
ncbi:MAG: hypothetical protein ACLFR0_03575 [Alphaproteobacteria bacterium]